MANRYKAIKRALGMLADNTDNVALANRARRVLDNMGEGADIMDVLRRDPEIATRIIQDVGVEGVDSLWDLRKADNQDRFFSRLDEMAEAMDEAPVTPPAAGAAGAAGEALDNADDVANAAEVTGEALDNADDVVAGAGDTLDQTSTSTPNSAPDSAPQTTTADNIDTPVTTGPITVQMPVNNSILAPLPRLDTPDIPLAPVRIDTVDIAPPGPVRFDFGTPHASLPGPLDAMPISLSRIDAPMIDLPPARLPDMDISALPDLDLPLPTGPARMTDNFGRMADAADNLPDAPLTVAPPPLPARAPLRVTPGNLDDGVLATVRPADMPPVDIPDSIALRPTGTDIADAVPPPHLSTPSIDAPDLPPPSMVTPDVALPETPTVRTPQASVATPETPSAARTPDAGAPGGAPRQPDTPAGTPGARRTDTPDTPETPAQNRRPQDADTPEATARRNPDADDAPARPRTPEEQDAIIQAARDARRTRDAARDRLRSTSRHVNNARMRLLFGTRGIGSLVRNVRELRTANMARRAARIEYDQARDAFRRADLEASPLRRQRAADRRAALREGIGNVASGTWTGITRTASRIGGLFSNNAYIKRRRILGAAVTGAVAVPVVDTATGNHGANWLGRLAAKDIPVISTVATGLFHVANWPINAWKFMTGAGAQTLANGTLAYLEESGQIQAGDQTAHDIIHASSQLMFGNIITAGEYIHGTHLEFEDIQEAYYTAKEQEPGDRQEQLKLMFTSLYATAMERAAANETSLSDKAIDALRGDDSSPGPAPGADWADDFVTAIAGGADADTSWADQFNPEALAGGAQDWASDFTSVLDGAGERVRNGVDSARDQFQQTAGVMGFLNQKGGLIKIIGTAVAALLGFAAGRLFTDSNTGGLLAATALSVATFIGLSKLSETFQGHFSDAVGGPRLAQLDTDANASLRTAWNQDPNSALGMYVNPERSDSDFANVFHGTQLASAAAERERVERPGPDADGFDGPNGMT